MGFITVAVLGGLAVGYARGGRLRHLAARSFRHWWLLPVGALLQIAPDVATVPAPAAWVAGSYVALAAFALANLQVVGMSVALVGLALNVAVIFANGAMPVRAEALVAAGVAAPGDVHDLRLGAKRRLEQPGDRLTALGDVVPVPALGEVLSFGDLVLAAGVGNVVARLLEPRRRELSALRLRRRPRGAPPVRAAAPAPSVAAPAPPPVDLTAPATAPLAGSSDERDERVDTGAPVASSTPVPATAGS